MCEAMEIIQARLRPADIHNMADVSLVRMFKMFTPTEDMQANNNKVSTSEDTLVGDKDRLHTCLHVNHETDKLRIRRGTVKLTEEERRERATGNTPVINTVSENRGMTAAGGAEPFCRIL